MNAPAERGGELATIDHLFSVLDAPRRPLDFTLVFRLADAPPAESLRAGARSARNVYPVTASRVVRRRWVRFDKPTDELTTVSVSNDDEAATAIEEFADAPFDPRRHAPVRQLLLTNRKGAGTKLVTRFHHAAADGLSAALWLGHQLRVATGEEPPAREASPFEPLRLRAHASPVRRSRFAYAGPSDPLLLSPGSRPSRTRRWLTVEIAAAELRAACRKAGGFTYNDLLATCALETFARWNRAHGAGRDQKVGLWLPVNVRRRPSAGFGNGTSRVRLYARYAGAATLADKCREVRRQLAWCVERGEWAVPESSPLARLPRWAAAPLLHAYLGSARVDMATGIFSHAEGWARDGGEVFRRVEGIECVGQLHARHSAGIYGATHAGRTWLTFTYDPGLLARDDARRLTRMYEEQIDAARRELT